MALELKVDSGVFKKQGKVILISTLLFTGLFVLVYATGSKIYTNLNKIVSDTKEVERDIELLSAKASSLKKIDKETTSAYVDALEVSFPYEDASLFLFSEIKALALKRSVTIESIGFSLGATQGNEVSASTLSLGLKGERKSVVEFISDLTKTAPLSGLGSITFSEYAVDADEFSISMSLEGFFSPLPVTVPTQNNITQTLSAEENKIADELSKLQVLSDVVSVPGPLNDPDANPFIGAVASGSGEKE